MKPEDFSFLAEIVRRRSGLVLPTHKAPLIEGRLSSVMRRFGFRSAPTLINELRHGHDGLARAVSEAMTTNESSFFRDKATFDKFRDVILPPLISARAPSKRLRIWCAACAAGQEAYSIAMILSDLKLPAKGWSIDLFATDLSSEMIARAELGVYSHYEVQRGLGIRKLSSHFTQEGESWRIRGNIRRLITFRQFTLLDSYGWLDDLDIVFCRNVLLYFNHTTKASVLERISEILVPDGALLLGHTETADVLPKTFARLARAPDFYVHARQQVPKLAVVG